MKKTAQLPGIKGRELVDMMLKRYTNENGTRSFYKLADKLALVAKQLKSDEKITGTYLANLQARDSSVCLSKALIFAAYLEIPIENIAVNGIKRSKNVGRVSNTHPKSTLSPSLSNFFIAGCRQVNTQRYGHAYILE